MNVAPRINEMQFPHLDKTPDKKQHVTVFPQMRGCFLFPQMDWEFRKIALLLGRDAIYETLVSGIFQLTASVRIRECCLAW